MIIRLASVDSETYTVNVDPSDELLNRLELYCQRATVLERRSVYQKPLPALESPSKPWSLEREEAVFAFLHSVRPFILESDWLYFPKVANELKRLIRDARFHELVENHQATFRNAIPHSRRVNNKVLNEEKQLDNWLQGYEYHVTPKRRSEVHIYIDEQATAQLFLPILLLRAHVAVALASVGRIILRTAGRRS